MKFRIDDTQTRRKFRKYSLEPQIDYITVDHQRPPVRVISMGENDDRAVIFIHGAPGSSSDFYGYLRKKELISKGRLITYDRPGYGYSGLGNPVENISQQARILHQLIDILQLKSVILAGHSYGGPIAAYTALLNNAVKGIVMIAPAIAPHKERYFLLGKLTEWSLTRNLVPLPFQVAAFEKKHHKKELQKAASRWNNLSIPAKVIHGRGDLIVPFGNLRYVKEAFPADLVEAIPVTWGNHFLPWTHRKLISRHIASML
ncbi:alpha/beta fold hydrolase [Robertkochia aurantiaca]|uniref:alpha/beta fold hydrolase n=1 Tax=Robertkochia aurantiaca TaxID=2873700 RepID=UPI001CD016B0|nr:alpha/beta hydrolase [Robertkochia sp. 3YJGBD-33]